MVSDEKCFPLSDKEKNLLTNDLLSRLFLRFVRLLCSGKAYAYKNKGSDNFGNRLHFNMKERKVNGHEKEFSGKQILAADPCGKAETVA